MLFMFRARLEKQADVSNQAFYGLWQKESEAAVSLLQSGAIKWAYKVAGTPEIVAVVDVDSHDALDHLVHALPIYVLGQSHIVKDLTWTPLREYANWYEDLRQLAVAPVPA